MRGGTVVEMVNDVHRRVVALEVEVARLRAEASVQARETERLKALLRERDKPKLADLMRLKT